MASEMTLGEIKKMAATLQGWEDMKREVLHYFSQGADCFTVSDGPWTLTFDNTKEREVKNAKEKKELTDWDWTTLVAAWRYYEYRSTIASAAFPNDIVDRFFKGDYSVKSCRRIAYQFAITDHGIRGEEDWQGNHLLYCDIESWTTFYAFCKAYCDGFTHLTYKFNGEERTLNAFYCQTTGRWHDKDSYIKQPYNPPYIVDEFIITKKEEKNDGNS